MGNSNRSFGNRFEDAFAKQLAADGFWVTKLTQTAAGQPADLIACKNSTPFLIDCKVCATNTFPLSRIEPNQRTAIEFWRSRGNTEYWFALSVMDKGIWMLDSDWAMYRIKHGDASISDLTDNPALYPYEKWIQLRSHKWYR